jgi:hypothetical protein
MKYLLIHTLDESTVAGGRAGGKDDALQAWIEEMTARGVVLDGSRLRPVADATTVRRTADGATVVTDGPFAETKEQVAGYDVIDCPDLDAAVAVAAAHPTTEVGSIEVRAFDSGMPDPEVTDEPAPGKLRYLMLVCANMRRAAAAAADEPAAPSPDDVDDSGDGLDEVDAWIADAGPRRLYGWALEHPDQAVTVRRADGRTVTLDGPFAETKEQIAGYDLLECDDLDDAIEVAAGHPVAQGGLIELRPLWR